MAKIWADWLYLVGIHENIFESPYDPARNYIFSLNIFVYGYSESFQGNPKQPFRILGKKKLRKYWYLFYLQPGSCDGRPRQYCTQGKSVRALKSLLNIIFPIGIFPRELLTKQENHSNLTTGLSCSC